MSKAISEIFDVDPVRKEFPVQTTDGQQDVGQDANLASDNIKQLLEIGMESLREAAAVASTQESPRAYEVVSNMIRSLQDMNLQLLDIHAKKKAIQQSASQNNQHGGPGGNTTNNAIFVGTTKDINELIMKRLGQSNE